MSDSWSEGYFTDIGYTYGYYRELSPVYQRFCLLLKGIAPPDTEQPTYCELGFGQGVSVNVHAAAVPGRFLGNDFNPEHAAYASALARKSASGAALSDDSFEEMLHRADIPPCDYISLHGIWSWVSQDNRRLIVEFARKHLRPGGVLYVSYNCHPGWSAYGPLRQVLALHDRFADNNRSASDRVEAALAFAEQVLAAKPRYGATAAAVEDRLRKIKEPSRTYLAHEYFNREWNTMYFLDVADAFAPAKLAFAASCNAFDVVDVVNLTPDQSAFLKQVENPLLREQIRDYMTNCQFRKDLYVRGARRLRPAERQHLLLEARFALAVPTSAIQYTVDMAVGRVDLRQDIYRPLVEHLSAQHHSPKTMRELWQSFGSATAPFDAVLQALAVMVGHGWVVPCQSEAAAKAARPCCERLNGEIQRQNLFSGDVPVLASPVAGLGIVVPRFSQLFLLARQRRHPDPAAFAADVLRANGESILKDGQPLTTPEENLAHLRSLFERFQTAELPLLRTFGMA